MNDIFNALFGGILIGLAGILLLWADGKVAGISGMLGALFRAPNGMNSWRYAFLGGLVCGGFLIHHAGFNLFSPLESRSAAALIAAGLLVGLGTQIGSGCTSGHGVCGLGRRSIRSLAATLAFMGAGAATVFIIRSIAGNAL